MKIEKKVLADYFDKIMSGEKTFELRLADFDCQIGDILVLREWNPETKSFTGRAIEKKVTFIFKTKGQKFWPENEVKKYGYQVMSLK